MVDWVVLSAALLGLVVPGGWIAVSGVSQVRAARRIRGMEPTPVGELSEGPAVVEGTVDPLFPDEALPAPLSAGVALVYSYRVVRTDRPDAPLDYGETIARGNAAVPFVVGDGEESVVVQPEGAEIHLGSESVERVYEAPPSDRVANFVEFHDVEVDFEDETVAVGVRELVPGDRAYVTGLVERVDEESVEEFPGEFVVRGGFYRLPFVVADRPGAGTEAGQLGGGVFKLLVGLTMLGPGLVVGALAV